ncbi:RES family NAD+ phosphorylase [Burkholderia glumae]|uniref:RES family NAD+ phosphorylase n=1 Tax=Burkholderia glumae TaxID=337 RepID=UPI003B9D631C
MILTPLQDITAYRMHVPKWAVAPTSGAGAARAGGRANRVGTPALYLALEVATAVAEYQQLSPLLPPGTLVSYRVTATPVVDFTGGFRADLWPPLWESFFCDWRRDWFNARIEPPSWVLGDEAIAAGAKGSCFGRRRPPAARTWCCSSTSWGRAIAWTSTTQPAPCRVIRLHGTAPRGEASVSVDRPGRDFAGDLSRRPR